MGAQTGRVARCSRDKLICINFRTCKIRNYGVRIFGVYTVIVLIPNRNHSIVQLGPDVQSIVSLTSLLMTNS